MVVDQLWMAFVGTQKTTTVLAVHIIATILTFFLFCMLSRAVRKRQHGMLEDHCQKMVENLAVHRKVSWRARLRDLEVALNAGLNYP